MVNRVFILGRMGQKPEVKHTANGQAIANISIATTEKFSDKQGNKQEKTEWHRVVAFGKQAEIIGEYTDKGSKIYVEGKIQTRSYEKDGITHYSTEVIVNDFRLLDSKKEQQDAPF
ncbi:MAG TPA: single-stranded DNA-binding protein [Nitrosomonas sp.]|nr:single-stranded DNA-binding protein [Nitrosomonas sp.]